MNALSVRRALSTSSNVLARLTFPARRRRVGVAKTSSARESNAQAARRNGAESGASIQYVYPDGDRDAGWCKPTRSTRTSQSAASRRDSLVDLARWQFRDTLKLECRIQRTTSQRVFNVSDALASARVFPPASFIDEPRRTSEEKAGTWPTPPTSTSEGRQCVLGLMWSCPRRGGLEMRSGAHSLH